MGSKHCMSNNASLKKINKKEEAKNKTKQKKNLIKNQKTKQNFTGKGGINQQTT